MKKTLILSFLLGSFAAFAQPNLMDRDDMEQKREKIEAIKVAYLTEELDLTVEESQKFWPVYNELQNKEHELREAQRTSLKGLDRKASEKDIEKMIYTVADTHIAIEELRKSYLDDFIEIVGAKKTAKLLKAEKEFGRKVMERMKRSERPTDRGMHPGPGGGRPMR